MYFVTITIPCGSLLAGWIRKSAVKTKENRPHLGSPQGTMKNINNCQSEILFYHITFNIRLYIIDSSNLLLDCVIFV